MTAWNGPTPFPLPHYDGSFVGGQALQAQGPAIPYLLLYERTVRTRRVGHAMSALGSWQQRPHVVAPHELRRRARMACMRARACALAVLAPEFAVGGCALSLQAEDG